MVKLFGFIVCSAIVLGSCASTKVCRTVCLPQDEKCKRVCKDEQEWR